MEENREKGSNNTNLKVRKYVYYISGVLEVLLAIRLLFKLLGANPGNVFVSFIYSITESFLLPFGGIFRTAVIKGIERQAILEPATIIGMAVYALAAWGVIKLIEINKNP